MKKVYELTEEEYNEYIYLKTLKKSLEIESFDEPVCPYCKQKYRTITQCESQMCQR
jgi:hypothetical protein